MVAIQIRVDQSLADILERVRRDVATHFKQQYGLEQVTISGTLTSRIVAARLNGRETLNFVIKKNGINRGIIELI